MAPSGYPRISVHPDHQGAKDFKSLQLQALTMQRREHHRDSVSRSVGAAEPNWPIGLVKPLCV